MFVFQFGIFAGPEPGAGDFSSLEAQQIELLRIRLLVHYQFRLLRFQVVVLPKQVAEASPLDVEAAECIKDLQLARGMKERLMVVRPVDIQEGIAKTSKDCKRRGRAIYELPIGACRAERAPDDEL